MFLIISLEMPMLLVHGPHLEQQSCSHIRVIFNFHFIKFILTTMITVLYNINLQKTLKRKNHTKGNIGTLEFLKSLFIIP